MSFAIYCIGRNYDAHIKELQNTPDDNPAVFMKPHAALVTGSQIKLPRFSSQVDYETELVVRINREGFAITEDEADVYYNEIAIGLDLTARDLQTNLKEKRLPWLLAKGFRNSCTCSRFVDRSTLPKDIAFSMSLNGTPRQLGNTREMRHTIPRIVSFISQFFELRANDLIYTGTPAGVGPLAPGDCVTLFIEGCQMDQYEVVSTV